MDNYGLYEATRFVWQVNNGGLAQWLGNVNPTEEQFKSVIHALNTMGAERHAVVFSAFERHLRADHEGARAIANSHGFTDLGEFSSIKPIEREFFIENRKQDLIPMIAGMLRSLPTVLQTTPDRLGDRLAMLAINNPQREARKRAGPRVRWLKIDYEPERQVVEALCKKARMHMVSAVHFYGYVGSNGGDVRIRYVETDAGLVAVEIKQPLPSFSRALSVATLLSMPERRRLAYTMIFGSKNQRCADRSH